MKKAPLLAIIATVLILAVGCTSMNSVGKPSPILERIQQRGSIIVGTAANMPPLNMTTRSGVIGGLDIDLAQYIARSMGVELQLVTKNFAELLPALENGEVDMVISGMTMTPERNLKVEFVGPYHVTGKSFLTKKSSIAKTENPADLNSSNYTFTALDGSTSAELIQTAMPEAVFKPAVNYKEAVAMVLNNQADAMISDYHACVLALVQHPNADLIALISPFTYEPLGIALPPGDVHYLNWVSNFLNIMEASDGLVALKLKWIENTSWVNELP